MWISVHSMHEKCYTFLSPSCMCSICAFIFTSSFHLPFFFIFSPCDGEPDLFIFSFVKWFSYFTCTVSRDYFIFIYDFLTWFIHFHIIFSWFSFFFFTIYDLFFTLFSHILFIYFHLISHDSHAKLTHSLLINLFSSHKISFLLSD